MIKDYLDACAPLSEGNILGKLSHVSTRDCVPLNVSIELSLKCNFSCRHCYNYDRSGPLPAGHDKEVLSDAEIKDIMKQLSQAGTLNLCFTGGEVLLHPGLSSFIREARILHMIPRIKTNASLLTKKLASDLKESGLVAVDISLYGASASTHEAFTRTKGTFEATLQGIRNSLAEGFETSVSLIIHRGNFREYPEMVELMGKIGAPFGTSVDVSARNDCTMDSTEERLTSEEFSELLRMPGGERFLEERPFDNLQCACARLNCGISYRGEVFPCVGAPLFCGSLKEQTFEEVWENSNTLNWIRGLGKEDFADCEPCPMKRVCPRNSGVTWSNKGSYTAKEEWSCMASALIQDRRNELGLLSSDPIV